MSDMGVMLAALRKQAGLTQEALAEAAGCDRSYVAMIETGRRSPSWRFLLRLADALSMSAVDLFQALDMVPPPVVDEAEISAMIAAYPDLQAALHLAQTDRTILEKFNDYARMVLAVRKLDEQGERTTGNDTTEGR